MEKLNLVQKLAKIRAMADAVSKDKQGYGYKYADLPPILAMVTAGMNKYGVSLIPLLTPGATTVEQVVTVNTKVDKATKQTFDQKSTEVLVRSEMVFRWIDDDNPSDSIDVPWVIIGSQSDPSQAFGSGLTYCTRYFLTTYFNIAIVDSDVDGYRSQQKAAAEAEDKQIAEALITEFDSKLRQYLADHPEKKAELEMFVANYAKKGNYLAIKDPALAAKLSTDFDANYAA